MNIVLNKKVPDSLKDPVLISAEDMKLPDFAKLRRIQNKYLKTFNSEKNKRS